MHGVVFRLFTIRTVCKGEVFKLLYFMILINID